MIDVGFIDRVRRGSGSSGNLEGLDHLWECQWVDARGEGLCHGY